MAEGDAFSILLLTRYSQNGASSRLRCYNYLSILERTGFQVTNAAFFGGDYVDKLYRGKFYGVGHLLRDYAKRVQRLLFAQSYDLIWIEKEVLPYLPACFERVFFGDKPYVVDYDDLWHLRYTEQRNPLVRGILSHKLETIARRAAAVVVGNPVLADWAHRAGAQRVIEIPTVVDLKRYQSKPLPDGRFTIGWIGTPITEKYLEVAAEPLRYMQERFGAKVRLIGVSENFSIPGVEIERVPWHEDTEADELSRCHVGIMPLTDGPWERGKCGYKLVQYMASARATVASPVGFKLGGPAAGRGKLFAQRHGAEAGRGSLRCRVDDFEAGRSPAHGRQNKTLQWPNRRVRGQTGAGCAKPRAGTWRKRLTAT